MEDHLKVYIWGNDFDNSINFLGSEKDKTLYIKKIM
jgi:hypothetical protein